jgi:hypothetical protein
LFVCFPPRNVPIQRKNRDKTKKTNKNKKNKKKQKKKKEKEKRLKEGLSGGCLTGGILCIFRHQTQYSYGSQEVLVDSGAWWHTPLIPALGRQRQVDF